MSGGVWFTSDLHFGHRLVARHRGFGDNTEEHDLVLCQRWVEKIKPDDQVWVLGDIAVSSPNHALTIMRDLPGHKHLISGNHDGCHPMHRDSHKHLPRYLEVFESVQAFARRRINGEEVLLSHFPYSRDRGEARYTQYRLRNEGRWLLHGHTHGKEKVTHVPGFHSGISGRVPPTREIHVGVDAWGLRPVSLGQVADLMKEVNE